MAGPSDPTTFGYRFEALPPGRLGTRRWRWELWGGEALLAAGWNVTPRRAHQSLRTAASRATHELAGLSALRPERTRALGPELPGATVRVDCGAVECLLVPREVAGRDEAAAAA